MPPALAAVARRSLVLAVVLAACTSQSVCSEVPLSAEAARALDDPDRRSEFPLTRPCAFGSRFEVTRVSEDVIPERGVRYPRVSFSVARAETHAFVLSQTEATLPFRAIPQGSHRLRASTEGVLAEGFAGPAGTGDDIAYLRWRRGGVTFELAATLRPWLTEGDVQRIAEALMRR
jgi:hypothetical protein